MTKEHPKYQIPDTPHGKALYASAKKHAEAAKKLVNLARKYTKYLRK